MIHRVQKGGNRRLGGGWRGLLTLLRFFVRRVGVVSSMPKSTTC